MESLEERERWKWMGVWGRCGGNWGKGGRDKGMGREDGREEDLLSHMDKLNALPAQVNTMILLIIITLFDPPQILIVPVT